jgi:hypothetical protein
LLFHGLVGIGIEPRLSEVLVAHDSFGEAGFLTVFLFGLYFLIIAVSDIFGVSDFLHIFLVLAGAGF